MSNLIIVESPSKAKTIGKYLGSHYKVIASVGHVRDLPKSKLGIDIENGFKPQYINMPDKKEDVDGEYELFVSGESIGVFFYAKEDSISSAKSALSDMDETALDEALASGSEHYFALGAMGFDIEGYGESSDKSEVCSVFKAEYENTMTAEETAKCFNAAIGIVNINSGNDVSAELNKLNPVFENTEYIENLRKKNLRLTQE